MGRRERLFGIAEKLAKRDVSAKAHRKFDAPISRRLRARR
jgi:hypothetical protein